MVVASSCLAFRALITQARIWKSFRVQNSTSLLYLPIPSSAETWKIVAKKVCQSFFALADILSEKSLYFGKHLFAKQELITRARLRGLALRLARICLLISAMQRVLCFFSRNLFYKSNRKLFSCVCIAWYKHSRRWENSRQLCKPSTSSRVCITVSNSPNPSRVYIRLCKHRKRFLLLKYPMHKLSWEKLLLFWKLRYVCTVTVCTVHDTQNILSSTFF